MDLFNSLPEEITLDIISRLPAEDVLECKLVCTNWRSVVRNPLFSKMHLHHVNHPVADSGKLGFIAMTWGKIFKFDRNYSFNFQYLEFNENHQSIERITRLNYKPPFGYETRFAGPCNGLVCLYQDRLPGKIYICNPITREYIMLPEMKIIGMGRETNNGFGYVDSTNEYKVVIIIFENKSKFMEVYVYTLGSGNGWRHLGKFNFGTINHWGEGVFFNGFLYWMDCHLRKIVTFDLAEEKLSDLSPPPLPSDYFQRYQLKVLDGCLSFAIYGQTYGAEYWDVWLLKNKDDNHCMKEREGHQSMGWRKEFRVFDREEFWLSDIESDSYEEFRHLNSQCFAVTKSYGVLIHSDKHIFIHNPNTSMLKCIKGFKERLGGIFPHKNTLVSLKELGEEDTKMMESVEIEETESHAQPFNQLLEDETLGIYNLVVDPAKSDKLLV